MPRIKQTAPSPDKNKGQRSTDISDLPLYLNRFIPGWNTPNTISAATWREVVRRQAFASICRDTLITNFLALDWKIEPRDSSKRDELKDDIDYYTRFFEDTGEVDYSYICEWVLKDTLDLPFGGAAELGYENDNPNQRLVWVKPLDAGTLYPSYNQDFPVGQYYPDIQRTVYFPKYAIDRIFISPHTEIKREGWGVAPPEKIYLALELLNRGDVYYSCAGAYSPGRQYLHGPYLYWTFEWDF